MNKLVVVILLLLINLCTAGNLQYNDPYAGGVPMEWMFNPESRKR